MYKKGNLPRFSNYRPVALICIACKIMKTFIKDLLIDHFNLNNIISINQHGFLLCYSTSFQLLECVNDCTQANILIFVTLILNMLLIVLLLIN